MNPNSRLNPWISTTTLYSNGSEKTSAKSYKGVSGINDDDVKIWLVKVFSFSLRLPAQTVVMVRIRRTSIQAKRTE